jgi:hypothetical protein
MIYQIGLYLCAGSFVLGSIGLALMWIGFGG